MLSKKNYQTKTLVNEKGFLMNKHKTKNRAKITELLISTTKKVFNVFLVILLSITILTTNVLVNKNTSIIRADDIVNTVPSDENYQYGIIDTQYLGPGGPPSGSTHRSALRSCSEGRRRCCRN